MKLVDWDEKYSVKINLIDGQHKKLFELANEFHKTSQNGRSEIALKQLLDGLQNYTSVHFDTEERLFAEFGYDEIEAHKLEHKIITLKINDLVAKWEIVENPEEEVSKFLKIWLEKHILETDHKYISCFHLNGMH